MDSYIKRDREVRGREVIQVLSSEGRKMQGGEHLCQMLVSELDLKIIWEDDGGQENCTCVTSARKRQYLRRKVVVEGFLVIQRGVMQMWCCGSPCVSGTTTLDSHLRPFLLPPHTKTHIQYKKPYQLSLFLPLPFPLPLPQTKRV
jgi:hypothetical protein